MSIAATISEKTVGIWYFEIDPGHSDVMGVLNEVEADKEYSYVYRFNYYHSRKPFDPEDVKHVYSWIAKDVTRAYIISVVRESFSSMNRLQRIAQLEQQAPCEILNDTTYEDFVRRLRDASFFNARKATPEEMEEIRRNRPN